MDVNLWKLVTFQQCDGSFIDTDTGTIGNYVWFSVIADWIHPVSTLIALRAIPWLLENQNKDGSWGYDENKGYTTIAVVKVLKKTGIV